MIELRPEIESPETPSYVIPHTFHSSFYHVNHRLQKWIARFPQSFDNSILADLLLLFFVAARKYLDHRHVRHLARLVLSIHLMQKKLLREATFFPNTRHIKTRWIPTTLSFPFSNKTVLGCLIGFNVLDKYELFEEENILLALHKQFPKLRFVKESSYHHTSQHKNLKIFYFEIENETGSLLSLEEKKCIKANIKEKVKNSIQKLSPALYIGNNEEEVYKNILVLSQEIKSLQDLPQANINLDQQTGKEIVFRITLVYISPSQNFSLRNCFNHCTFSSYRLLTVKQIENHALEAHIFYIHLAREASLLRSDGSLDFYSARQRVVSLIKNAIGEFHDHNGGIIIKQEEKLQAFKKRFPDISAREPDLLETFFYALMPLEKQAVLEKDVLSNLFTYFLENRNRKLTEDPQYPYKFYRHEHQNFLIVQGDSSLTKSINAFLKEQSYIAQDIAYNVIDVGSDVFFNCVFLNVENKNVEAFIQGLRHSIDNLQKKMKGQQVLRIALGNTIISLDPRIGGETASADVLKLLFEGLTRFNQNGDLENALTESIEVSSSMKHYTFKLRTSLWNDGTLVTAHDFEYAWKKILSPNFKTSFSYFFYPIKHAKEAKEGKVHANQIGIQAVDDLTLKVELAHPTPNFLQLIAHPLFSPINRIIDQQYPEWSYQCEKNYPCNGPFQLKINQPNQGYQLVKNPFYWEANQIALDQITLTQMNHAQAIQSFQNKEIDWIGNPFGTWHPSYNNIEGQRISFPDSLVCWCVFNTAKPPFHHPKLRQAFAYAIDRSKVIANAYLKLNPAYSILLPYNRQKNQSQFPLFDAKKAQSLLNEALEELNLKKEDLPPLSLTFHRSGLQSIIAPSLREQFKNNLNIECELEPLSWNQIFNKMTKGDFQIGLMLWTSYVDDPIYTFNAFKSSKQEINFAKWENSTFENLIDLSEQEMNPFQRSFYLIDAEEVLIEEMPVIPIFYQPYQALVAKNLSLIIQKSGDFLNISRNFYKKGI